MTGLEMSQASRILRGTGISVRIVVAIIYVTDATLRTWHALMEDKSVPVRQTRMVYTVNISAAEVWQRWLGSQEWVPLDLQFSRGWDESTTARRATSNSMGSA